MRLPAGGQPLHTRSLTIVLSQREDGQLQASGEIIDLRKCSMVPMMDEMQTAGIIHHMSIELGIDPAGRTIEHLEVDQPAVAVEASERTSGQSCRDPAPRLQALVGRKLDARLGSALGDSFGGPRGCSHLLTLFHLMASALPPALDFEAGQQAVLGAKRRAGEKIFRRSVCVDGYEPEEGKVQLSVLLMDYHSRPRALVVERLDHLARQQEVRALATIGLDDVRFRELLAWERERSRETLGTADWCDREEQLSALLGRPIMPGLGRELRRSLGPRPDARLLLDALLQLAPGFVQCTPALADRMLAAAARRSAAGGDQRPPLPGFMALGGAVGSCYMWREDGPLLQIRPRTPIEDAAD